jgi:hypothetical protein
MKMKLPRCATFKTGLMLRLAGPAAIGQELPQIDMIAEAPANNREIADTVQRPSQASRWPNQMFPPSWTSNGNPLRGAQLSVSRASA